MIFSGILHTSLGGFTVIRGVASLGELARCSDANEYQRDLIEDHGEEIKRFLADQQYLFFPEVILSAILESKSDVNESERKVNPITDIKSGEEFISNVNGMMVKVINRGQSEIVDEDDTLQLAQLILPDEEIENGLKLFRIDGNHRLSAINDTEPDDPLRGLDTPFCIVLHDNVHSGKDFEKAVFHNINAKQIPLTSEQNLKLILENEEEESLFDDDMLLDNPSFGPAYYLARKLLAVIQDDYLEGLKGPLDNRYSLALALCEFLREQDKGIKLIEQDKDIKLIELTSSLNEFLPKLKKIFQTVNRIYENNSLLAKNGCHGVLIAFLYFAWNQEGAQLEAFRRWVVDNQIDHLEPKTSTRGLGYNYNIIRTYAVDAASLVKVFEKVLTAKHREIFVSMEFDDKTTETYETIKEAVHNVNEKYQLSIKLREIRIDKHIEGHSYAIDDEILKVIEGTGLLIADLTYKNPNVYHEVGYLMGINEGRKQEQKNFILLVDKNEHSEESEYGIGFNLRNWKQLRFETHLQLKEELTTELEKYYL